MAETHADRELSQATIDAIGQRSYGHPAMHLPALNRLLSDLLPPLARAGQGTIATEQFDAVLRQVAEEKLLSREAHSELRTILIAYRLIRPGEGSYRVVPTTDAAPPWLGFDEVAGDALTQRQRAQRLAHLHMLAYPELVEAVELLAPPGRSEGDAERALKDRFAFTRKINANIAAYLLDVARTFELVAEHGRGLRNIWAPPSVLAALVVRRYLEFTEFVADRGVATADILRQCAAIVPGPFFQHHPATSSWFGTLRPPAGMLMAEAGGGQLRIRLEGLVWFARIGLLAPIHSARILRVRGARESHGRLRQCILNRLRDFSPLPVNAQAIEVELADK